MKTGNAGRLSSSGRLRVHQGAARLPVAHGNRSGFDSVGIAQSMPWSSSWLGCPRLLTSNRALLQWCRSGLSTDHLACVWASSRRENIGTDVSLSPRIHNSRAICSRLRHHHPDYMLDAAGSTMCLGFAGLRVGVGSALLLDKIMAENTYVEGGGDGDDILNKY